VARHRVAIWIKRSCRYNSKNGAIELSVVFGLQPAPDVDLGVWAQTTEPLLDQVANLVSVRPRDAVQELELPVSVRRRDGSVRVIAEKMVIMASQLSDAPWPVATLRCRDPLIG
jgi:hypothetical protein